MLKMRFALTAALALSGIGIGTLLAGPAVAQEAAVGQEEFRLQCAVCHGMTGLGDGPVGLILKTPAPNLAFIAERNGGKFPFQRIYEIIDGRADIAAHGTRDMPIWGERYSSEAKPVTPDQASLADLQAQQRILSLVYYIGTLQ